MDMPPLDWEQPETVELRADEKTGVEDYFSTTAQLRAEQSLHDKEQQKLTDELNTMVNEFEAKTIQTVEDTYDVKTRYKNITTKLPLLDDGDLRARLLERTETKYDEFETIISGMSDTIIMYEKQRAVDASKAQEQAEKDAEKRREELEKQTRKNEFLQALAAVEELE